MKKKNAILCIQNMKGEREKKNLFSIAFLNNLQFIKVRVDTFDSITEQMNM